MSFDPNMTYWQSLKIVASGFFSEPIINRRDLSDLREGSLLIVDTLGRGALRFLVRITFPISIPVLTWLVQLARKKTAKQIEEAKRKARDWADSLWRVNE